ncbi:MAG: response regulator transcription factor [Anaerolineae bacterium]|nr:response regulator transcription factor [Anaerolineae bacterium]
MIVMPPGVTHSPTQVIIVAQAALYRAAWTALLSRQPDIVVAGASSSLSEISPLLQPGRPTALLLDLPPLPPLIQQLKTLPAEVGLLFLVDLYELDQVVLLLQAGVTGCLTRDAPVADLARAIIAVGRGEIALPPAIAGRALAALARGEASSDGLIEPLSERESEVLHLLAQGLTNKDIAQTLILSVRTVEAHLRNIFGKLGVHSRTEAALWAAKHGYGPEG